MTQAKGLYIHIPFCDFHCHYCSFLTFMANPDRVAGYVDYLLKEIDLYQSDAFHLDTIYFGGGTPSVLTLQQIKAIMTKLNQVFIISDSAEITMKMNPESVTKEKVEAAIAGGVNRISLGVQSFDNQVLEIMGRLHREKMIYEKINLINRLGIDNISIDLMFNNPKQTKEVLEHDLELAMELDIKHISIYSLRIEKNTQYERWINRNTFKIKDDDDEREMYYLIQKVLKENNFIQYEISNFSKPGYNLQVASSNQYVIDFDIFPNPTDTRTLIPFLESIQTLDLFQTIVADSGYGSEQNYEAIIDDFEKEPLIPYTMYYREQTKQYKTNPKNRDNWNYDEESDYYTDLDGVRFSFSHYSQRTDKQGYVRDFKVYVADKDQLDERLNELAKTPKGRQRQTSVNQTWGFFKQQTEETLASDEGKTLYGKRKTDIETVFGRLKSVFGMRRAHVRGKQAVSTDIGFMLMSMNLTKLALESRKRSQTRHNNTHQNGNNRAKILIQILTRLFSFLGAVFSQPLFDV